MLKNSIRLDKFTSLDELHNLVLHQEGNKHLAVKKRRGRSYITVGSKPSLDKQAILTRAMHSVTAKMPDQDQAYGPETNYRRELETAAGNNDWKVEIIRDPINHAYHFMDRQHANEGARLSETHRRDVANEIASSIKHSPYGNSQTNHDVTSGLAAHSETVKLVLSKLPKDFFQQLQNKTDEIKRNKYIETELDKAINGLSSEQKVHIASAAEFLFNSAKKKGRTAPTNEQAFSLALDRLVAYRTVRILQEKGMAGEELVIHKLRRELGYRKLTKERLKEFKQNRPRVISGHIADLRLKALKKKSGEGKTLTSTEQLLIKKLERQIDGANGQDHSGTGAKKKSKAHRNPSSGKKNLLDSIAHLYLDKLTKHKNDLPASYFGFELGKEDGSFEFVLIKKLGAAENSDTNSDTKKYKESLSVIAGYNFPLYRDDRAKAPPAKPHAKNKENVDLGESDVLIKSSGESHQTEQLAGKTAKVVIDGNDDQSSESSKSLSDRPNATQPAVNVRVASKSNPSAALKRPLVPPLKRRDSDSLIDSGEKSDTCVFDSPRSPRDSGSFKFKTPPQTARSEDSFRFTTPRLSEDQKSLLNSEKEISESN